MVSSHNGRWRGAALGERREIALSRLGSASSGSSGAKYKYFSPTFETSLSDSDCNRTVCYSITKGGISSHLHITPTNNKLRYVPIIIFRNFWKNYFHYYYFIIYFSYFVSPVVSRFLIIFHYFFHFTFDSFLNVNFWKNFPPLLILIEKIFLESQY